jgi:sugar lactone lactonase YvrE
MAIPVEVALRSADGLGEGPCWDAVRRCLWRVDMAAPEVLGWYPESGREVRLPMSARTSVVIPAADGTLVVASTDRLVRVTDGGAELLCRLGDDRTPLNDGKCDPSGTLWIGTWSPDGRPAAALYRVRPDGGADQVLTGLRASNGMGWSPDGTILYHVDTPIGSITAYETGDPARPRVLTRIARQDGLPDGLAVDADGGIWVALFGGSAIRRYRPDGTLDRHVPMPVSHPTSLAFGGDRLDILYVTTSRHRLDATEQARQPLAGAVLALIPPVPGTPVGLFGWPLIQSNHCHR